MNKQRLIVWKSVANAGREDRLQRVRGYDEEREPRAEPQETARRRPIGDRAEDGAS